MKKLICAILALSLCLLCGCAGGTTAESTAASTAAVPTEAPTAAATQAPTEIPTEMPTKAPTEAPTQAPAVFTNPLTGEILEENTDTRLFAVSINNVQGAMPMYGVSKADIFFEMFVNDYCTRGLALFSDIRNVKYVGSVRSLRYNFLDVSQAYDAIVCHAGGSNEVLGKISSEGVSNISVEFEGSGYFFRDKDRLNAGYPFEHTLFLKGADTLAYAERKGLRVTREEGRDFGLRFTEENPAAQGETAETVTIRLKHGGITKTNTMTYLEEQGEYLFHQFGKKMYDASEEQDICFKNVIVMFCNVTNQGVYHVAQLEGSGEALLACNGKIIPIRWVHEKETDPFTFTYADGTPVALGIGSSYIAFAPMASTVEYQ